MLSSPFDRPFTINLPPETPLPPPTTNDPLPEVHQRPNGSTSIFLKRKGGECLTQGYFGSEMPGELEGRMTEEEFGEAIERVNESLEELPTLWVGYIPCGVCSTLAVIFILLGFFGIGVEENFYVGSLWVWGFFFVMTFVGFGYYFYRERGLEEAIQGCNDEEREVEWKRGLGRRHGEIEIVFEDNCLEVEEEERGGEEVGMG